MAVLKQAAARAGSWPNETADIVEFFHQYKRSAFHFALQLTGNNEDALEMTQESFLRLHREWPKRDRSRDPAPWLFTVLRNLALDLLRKRSVRNECELENLPVASPAPGPESQALRNEVTARLWTEIRALPFTQREVLLLRDWHGLSYAQIAEVTGMNVSSVSSRLHDARTAIRKAMGGIYGPGRIA